MPAARRLRGGGRYIVFDLGRAEMAFVVVDAWQGRGVGSILMRHLVKLASDAGLQELTADVLPENVPMRKVFEKSWLHARRAPGPAYSSSRAEAFLGRGSEAGGELAK